MARRRVSKDILKNEWSRDLIVIVVLETKMNVGVTGDHVCTKTFSNLRVLWKVVFDNHLFSKRIQLI